MPTMTDLITRARADLGAAESTANAEQEGLVLMRGRVESGDATISVDAVKAAIVQRDNARRLVKSRRDSLNSLLDEKRKDDEIDRLSEISIPTGDSRRGPKEGTVFSITEPNLYSREATASGRPSFLHDLFRSQLLGDPAANERLAAHGREVESRGQLSQRSVATSGVAGFVPPQYLTDLFAEYARGGRPVANLCTAVPLPETGMTINVPRITTATTVASQATENSAVSSTDPASTTLAVPVVTIAGAVDVSRQALERGELVESITFGDLSSAYNAELDRQVINGSGASGQHAGILGVSGINAVTFTSGSPTAALFWPKLASAVGQVISGRFSGPSAIVLHPNTWAWVLSSLDTANRPLVVPGGSGAVNAMASTEVPVGYPGSMGQLMGVPVYLSGNIPTNLGGGTNETRVIAADFRDLFLFEDASAAPAQLRFDQSGPGSLTVKLVAYGYSAFAAGRQPKAVSVISGTGMITPAL